MTTSFLSSSSENRPLFDPLLIVPHPDSESTEEYIVKGIRYRPLHLHDYNLGFLNVLRQLTTVGDIHFDQFEQMFNKMCQGSYYIVVAESISDTDDTSTSTSSQKSPNKILGAATAFIEEKFIHSCGSVSHIEDVVVLSECRGKSVGKHLITILNDISKELGCYKVILDCSKKNIGFYEKCGFKLKEVQMVKYFKL